MCDAQAWDHATDKQSHPNEQLGIGGSVKRNQVDSHHHGRLPYDARLAVVGRIAALLALVALSAGCDPGSSRPVSSSAVPTTTLLATTTTVGATTTTTLTVAELARIWYVTYGDAARAQFEILNATLTRVANEILANDSSGCRDAAAERSRLWTEEPFELVYPELDVFWVHPVWERFIGKISNLYLTCFTVEADLSYALDSLSEALEAAARVEGYFANQDASG